VTIVSEAFGAIKCRNQFSDCQLLTGDISMQVVICIPSCSDSYYIACVVICCCIIIIVHYKFLVY
jgi:hypothetical protein